MSSSTSDDRVNLTICAFADVADLLKNNKYNAVISIKNPKENDNWTNMELIKRFRRFKDHQNQTIENEHILCMSFLDTNDPFRRDSPCNHHIGKIITLANNLKNHMKTNPEPLSVLIHCIAGISRSTASALILLEELGYPIIKAITKVYATRSIANPNNLMLKMYRDHKNCETLDPLI